MSQNCHLAIDRISPVLMPRNFSTNITRFKSKLCLWLFAALFVERFSVVDGMMEYWWRWRMLSKGVLVTSVVSSRFLTSLWPFLFSNHPVRSNDFFIYQFNYNFLLQGYSAHWGPCPTFCLKRILVFYLLYTFCILDVPKPFQTNSCKVLS